MSAPPNTLHRAAGRFTVLSGTNRILHFVEAIPNAIHASTDLYEVVLFRALRRSVRAGQVTSIDPDGSSFYLLAASILHRLATRKARPITRIRHLNAKLGAEFEGLKLLAETRQTGTLWFDALFPNRSVADDFDVMHRRIDRFQSSVRIGETRVSETYTAFRHGQDEETIDVIDWFKEHPVPIDAFLADRFTPESQTNRLLAVIRCGWDERIAVQDLFGESYTLPSMQDIREACTGLGLHASALFLQDFDRDFLLPFDGGYGLVVLYVTRWQDDLFEEAGFRALAGDSLGEQRAVVSAEQLDQPRSYDALFSAELPELQDPAPRDWQAWKAERDWDPGALDWNAGTRRGDGMIIPVAALDNLEISVKLARTLLVDDPDTPWLSAEGMVNAATVLHRHAPLESVYAVFLALDRAREAPRQVGYICQLFRQQTVGAFSEIFIRDLEDAETLSFQDACRHLCAALLEAGWLEGAENQANARTAVQHAIKDDPARLEIALASLAAAVA